MKELQVARSGVHQAMIKANAIHQNLAEIDAAIEIDENLESLLEHAADALAALQSYYDLSAAKNQHDGIWLVDNRTAAYIEGKFDDRNHTDPEGDLEVAFTSTKSKNTALGAFHLDTMLELSKDMFMNIPPHNGRDHWTEVALDDEQPSMTVDAVQTYYNLVKSLVQKVLQTALFLAESRIRSTTTPAYAPARLLKDIDIVAALNVLNMPTDSFEHWATYPRRSGVRVVLGVHEKGGSNAEALSLQQVEDALSVRASRGRRRSLSCMVSTPVQDGGSEEAQPMRVRYGEESIQEMTHGQAGGRQDRWSSVDMWNSILSDEAPDDLTFEDVGHSPTKSASNTSSDDDEPAEAEENDSHLSRKRRRMTLEEAQDEFLEKLDHSAKVKEAARLRHLLGLPDAEGEMDLEVGTRPKTMRKTVEELQDWSDTPYRSSWERKRSAQEAFGDA